MTDTYTRLIGTYEVLLVTGRKDLFAQLKVTDEGVDVSYWVKANGARRFSSLEAACREVEAA
jgi:hypothetical protein